ncbi:hypothetical protein E2C01_057164 [Portunus trituberculatus]|uniref:Uncharacterized protein n=1 Tax=Portunus trituberculatus TaxID=210409 RepID=A0A5B7GW28_PORTR|nr:hypothetical protein [Portunus trituberculatus]
MTRGAAVSTCLTPSPDPLPEQPRGSGGNTNTLLQDAPLALLLNLRHPSHVVISAAACRPPPPPPTPARRRPGSKRRTST